MTPGSLRLDECIGFLRNLQLLQSAVMGVAIAEALPDITDGELVRISRRRSAKPLVRRLETGSLIVDLSQPEVFNTIIGGVAVQLTCSIGKWLVRALKHGEDSRVSDSARKKQAPVDEIETIKELERKWELPATEHSARRRKLMTAVVRAKARLSKSRIRVDQAALGDQHDDRETD